MREFNKNEKYLSETPNIVWDDSFVPPELYDDLESEMGSLDTKEGQKVEGNSRESQRVKIEEQMAKEKANTLKNDKGKAKNTAQDNASPDETEYPKRHLVIDITSDNEDTTSSDESEPLAKRINRKESIDNVGIFPVPPPCLRCTISKIECEPNGWHSACKTCRKARQTCSLSKALPNDKGKAKETAEDDEKHDNTEKHKTQRLREIHTSIYALTKSILADKSLIEDEDFVDQLDEDLAKPSPKKKKVSMMTMDGFISNDPKVCL